MGGYQVGKGVGKNDQGRVDIVEAASGRAKQGLGKDVRRKLDDGADEEEA